VGYQFPWDEPRGFSQLSPLEGKRPGGGYVREWDIARQEITLGWQKKKIRCGEKGRPKKMTLEEGEIEKDTTGLGESLVEEGGTK